jgi:hypothetical protein
MPNYIPMDKKSTSKKYKDDLYKNVTKISSNYMPTIRKKMHQDKFFNIISLIYILICGIIIL